MIILGIESTAHTFGAAVIEDKNVLSNCKDSYTTESGGIDPTKAKLHHKKARDRVVDEAIKKAEIEKEDIDLISFSQGPGLPPCLVQGMVKAKELSKELDKPLVGVNHCIAHLSVGEMLTDVNDPVLLYTSGANTQIIAYEGGKYRIFGETLDMGVGNFIDSFARYIGLGFPGGPKIYELSLKSDNYIELPYVVKGMDVSFSGLLTNLMQKYDKGMKKEDLAYSLQETIFAMLLEVTERAMAHVGKYELLLGGGVACNKRLQEMAGIMCEERNAKCYVPDNEFLTDNAAMIAYQGSLERKRATHNLDKIDIEPYWRTDEVEVFWR